MLIAFTFRAKPGKEAEFERLLSNPETGKLAAGLMGASRNILFLGHGRMIRVLEVPEGVEPKSMAEIAEENPDFGDFLHKIAPLIQDGFDLDDPRSLEEFNKRVMVPLCYDVRP